MMNDPPPREDERNLERRRVLKGAMIEIKNQSSVDCVVRNLSTTGARLEVAEGFWIPEHFTLRVPSEGIVNRCEVRWRKAKGLGVVFMKE